MRGLECNHESDGESKKGSVHPQASHMSCPSHLPVLPCAPNRFMKTLALVPALNLPKVEEEVMIVRHAYL